MIWCLEPSSSLWGDFPALPDSLPQHLPAWGVQHSGMHGRCPIFDSMLYWLGHFHGIEELGVSRSRLELGRWSDYLVAVSNHYKTKGESYHSAGEREGQPLVGRVPGEFALVGHPVAVAGAKPLQLRAGEAALVPTTAWGRKVPEADFAMQP